MLALLFLLLFTGPCAPTDEEALFCESCPPWEPGDGVGGAGGTDGPAGAGGSEGTGGAGGEDSGHGGEGGGWFPPLCDCDDANPCNGTEYCNENWECETLNNPTPVDDHDRCTSNLCREGLPYYEPVDVDDGDPCTRDSCHPVFGVEHDPIEGCQS